MKILLPALFLALAGLAAGQTAPAIVSPEVQADRGVTFRVASLPIITLGSLGGTLATGRVLDYSREDDSNRKLCSFYLSLMDRMGVAQPRFGDADARLEGI